MNNSSSTQSTMRILHTESALGLGGQELRVLQEIVGMRKRGHQVFLAVQPTSQLAIRAQEQGVPIIPVIMRTGRWVFLVYRFLRIYEQYQIEVVNTHGSIDSWTASIAGRLSRRAPVLIRTRHKSTPVSKTFRHRLLYAKMPHMVVTTGESVRQGLIENTGVEPSCIVSIPTGVDPKKFYPREPDLLLRENLKIKNDRQIVGTIAFLRDYKGVNVFLQAAALVICDNPLVTFLIIGDGPERSNLENMTQELGLKEHVCFLGFREDIPRLLSILDVVVMCSQSAEGVPQVLTQALAMERAVVATSVGSISELIKDGETGLLVHPRDRERVALAIIRLLNEQALRENLGKTGCCSVNQSWTLTAMLDKTEALYKVALCNKNITVA